MAESSVFEELYKEELYVLPSRTVIALDKEWHECSEDEKTLLGKILSSVKLTPASVQIIGRRNFTVSEINSLDAKGIISFGVPVETVSQKYDCIMVSEVPVILSDTLASLDDQRKKNLWVALRKMFGI